MLSYNTPISVNGQNAGPTAGMSARPPFKTVGNNGSANGVSSNDAVSGTGRHAPEEQHIWLVTGPAGCGKSTVARYLAESLHWPYIEGDEVRDDALPSMLLSQLTKSKVSPTSQYRKDERRYPPYRCGPLGLAHSSARGINSSS